MNPAVSAEVVTVKGDGSAVGVFKPFFRFKSISEDVAVDHPCRKISQQPVKIGGENGSAILQNNVCLNRMFMINQVQLSFL